MSKQAKQSKIIPAVAYCRKSTNEERTEKSIADQTDRIGKLVPPDETARYEIVRWYDRDKGIPGWKRGAARPDFDRLVNELKETGARAILCDDMDRFSRADEFEVMHDVQELRESHRVQFIHSCNQGSVDLVHDQFAAFKIALAAMAGHEFSTRLSRRISLARRDAAMQGKRSGGESPYGLENDGKGGLKWGDPKQVKTVRWIFHAFVTLLKSMNWIAGELNRQGVPARRGGPWYVATIKELLKRREYCGYFVFNRKKAGAFHIINKDHEVVPISSYHDDKPKPWESTEAGIFQRQGMYKAIVPPNVFDVAQRRLAVLAVKGGRRPRANGYPLSRILVCDHCGRFLTGCLPTGRTYRVYRCCTPSRNGLGSCNRYQVREAVILPIVMRLLGEAIGDMKDMLTAPPPELTHPRRAEAEQRAQLERERAAMVAKIAVADENILLTKDARTRQALDARLTAMRDELERLEAQLSGPQQTSNGYTREEVERLSAWWDDFQARAVSVPVPDRKVDWTAATFYRDHSSEEQAILLDARVVNEALHTLGCEVRLRWKTERMTRRDGSQQNQYTLVAGRFRLGQRQGVIDPKTGVSFCKARPATS